VSPRHAHTTLARTPGDLVCEPRLADAGLARDQHERSATRSQAVHCGVQICKFAITPDEHARSLLLQVRLTIGCGGASRTPGAAYLERGEILRFE
jgi:hypothetical protein